ncbi:MAG: hypothetical protein IPH49_14770 [Ignavibacteria bacterium]|nr:hypothetical protein [Ignavibacteria bacterium]
MGLCQAEEDHQFPITIDKVKFAKLTPLVMSCSGGKVNLDIILALDSNRTGAEGRSIRPLP